MKPQSFVSTLWENTPPADFDAWAERFSQWTEEKEEQLLSLLKTLDLNITGKIERDGSGNSTIDLNGFTISPAQCHPYQFVIHCHKSDNVFTCTTIQAQAWLNLFAPIKEKEL